MNLVMLSQQLDPIDRLVTPHVVGLFRGRRGRVAYLPSAPDPKRYWFEPQRRCYAVLGLSLEYFGVEEDFDANRVDQLFAMDAIHLSGGNTFRFMHWLRMRNLAERVRDYVKTGGTLIGVSAGAIMMTPNIGTASLCGDQRISESETEEGLDLVNFLVVPHFVSRQEASAELLSIACRYRRDVYAIPDGAAILISGARTQVLGPVTVVHDASRTSG